MTYSTQEPLGRGQAQKVARGALINTMGAALRAVLVPLQLAVFGRLFGAHALGLFVWGYSCIEIMGALGISGFADAAVLFGARRQQQDGAFVRQATSLLRLTGALSLFFGLALAAAALPLERATGHVGLTGTLVVLAVAVPLTGLTRLMTSIPKARQLMGHDVWAQALALPVASIALAFAFVKLMPAHIAIAAAYTGGYAAAFIVAAVLLRRVAPLSRTWGGPGADAKEIREVVAFALPQNLNMGLNQLIAYMDVLMLGLMGVSPSDLALYGIGAQIIGNLRQIRTVVSDSLAPVFARHLHLGETRVVEDHIRRATGWILPTAFAAIALVAFFPTELVRIFNESFTGPMPFMYVLLIYPAFNCALGLMGNALVMGGHSRVNLTNSLAVGAIHAVLNLILIRRFGLMGAAFATAAATASIAVVQVIEARVLLALKFPWRPLLGWAFAALVVFALPFAFGAAAWPFSRRVVLYGPSALLWLCFAYAARRRPRKAITSP